MPRSIADIRKANGGLENLTDEDILQSTFQQYKSYYPSLDAYAAEVGYGGAGRSLTGSRIAAGIDQYQANLQGLGGAVSRAVGAEGLAAGFDRSRVANESAAAYAAQRARDLGGVEDWRDITGVGSALNYAGGLAAQSLPYLGEAVAGGLTGGLALGGTAARMGLSRAAGATAGAVGASYPSAVGDVLSAQREAGGENLGAAALGGVPYAALNALGVEGQLARGLRPLVRTEGGIGRRVAAGVAGGSFGEGLSETGQELINQYAGRMVINPDETLFNEEANKRYLDSFVGGATLGGLLGGVGGIRGPVDLTQSDTGTTTEAPPATSVTPAPRTGTLTGLDTASLMGSPYANANLLGGSYAGSSLVSPAILNQEADLTAPAATAAPTTTTTEAKPKAPSIFSELDTELNKQGIKPTKTSRDIYQYMVAEEIDPASQEAEKVLNALAASKPGEARKAIGEIIRARSPRVSTTVPSVQQPAGGVGVGGAVVPGVVGNAGSAAPVAGTMVRSPAVAGRTLQQTGILPSTTGQPTTPVTTGAPSGTQAPQTVQAAPQGQAPTTVPSAAPAIKPNTTLRLNKQEALPGETDITNLADIARMTGNAGGIDAALEDEAGLRRDQTDFTADDLETVVERHLSKSKDKERDRQILNAYLTARRAVPEGYKGNIAKEIAASFGVAESRVRQIGNPELLANTAESMGFDRSQVFDVIGVQSAKKAAATELGKLEGELGRLESKAKPSQADIDRMSELSEQIDRAKGNIQSGDLASALKDMGLEGEAGESFATMDDSRDWQKASTAGSQLAEALVSTANAAKALRDAAAELKALGLTEAADAAEARAVKLDEKYKATAAAAVEKAAPVSKATATVKEAQQRWKDAGRDITKLSSEDLGLLLPYVRDTIKNTELAGKITAELESRGETNAVQVESTASVPVQPKTETGQGVGSKVRRAPKPAAEVKAPTQILTQAEQAAQAWDVVAADFPSAPKFADLTKAQQNTFIGFGPDNWTKADVETELTKLAKTSKAVVPWSNIKLTTKGDVELVPTTSLALVDQRNKADTTTPEYAALKASILEKGIVNPIIITTNSLGRAEVFEGNHRLQVARELGLAEVPVVLHSRTNQSESYPVVGRKPSSLLPKITSKEEEVGGVKFGKEGAPVREPYTAKQLLAELKDFIRADIPGRKLTVVDSVADLLTSTDKNIRAVGAGLQLEGAYGVAVNGRAFLVANRIKQGSGRAKFMHEVGGHLGLDNLLTKADQDKLVNQIKNWARKADGSLETELALQAFERVQAAQTPVEDRRSELIAYFIESAMEMGVDPTAATGTKLSGPLREWFRTLWAAFKVAARKLGVKPESMTAQDVVNLAYGAARLEINGTWHGTAADFRKFNNEFMGTGEGAQAYGWGTYLAQRTGIAKGYWSADVARKTTGGVFRMADRTPITDSQFQRFLNDARRSGVDTTFEWLKRLEADNKKLLEKYRAAAPRMASDAQKLEYTLTEIGDAIQAGGVKYFEPQSPEGTLMRVDTVITPEETLDWDRPLSKQPAILEKLSMLMPKGLQEALADQYQQNVEDIGELTGEDLYRGLRLLEKEQGLVSEFWGTDKYVGQLDKKVASLFLDSMGIKGIQFLDANSRGASGDVLVDRKSLWGTVNGDAWAAMVDSKGDIDAAIAELKKQEQGFNSFFADNATEGIQQLESLRGQDIQYKAKVRTRNLVIFDDKNIFRVGSEVAADRQRMKFGKNAPTKAQVASAVAKLPKQAQQPVNNSINTIGDWARQGLDRLVFTSDLINRAVDAGIKSAKTFEGLLAKRDTKARSLEREVERIADTYAGIEEANKGDGPNSVNQFIFESTRTGKWGYDSGSFKADPKMAAQFNALGPKAQAYAKSIFTHGNKMLSDKKKAVIDYATSEYDARIAAETDPVKKAAYAAEKADSLKNFASLFKIREGIPYAPIKRFGSYVVFAKSAAYRDAEKNNDTKLISKLEKDPDHYHVSFTETKNEARNLADQLKAQGHFDAGLVDFGEREDKDKSVFGGAESLKSIERLRAVARSDDKQSASMLKAISDMYLQALAESSARKSEMRRRGVSGEIDMLRSFAAQGRADANFVASVEYNPQVQDALQAMRNEKNDEGSSRTRRTELFNEIVRRYESSLDVTPTPTINKITRLSSIYYLATSPAYYMQNLTQPWMMSVPAMAGRHDYAKSSAALFTAYGQLGGVMKSARYDRQFDFSKVPGDVQAAIQELANRGKIDIGLETELGEFKIEGDGAFSKGWNKVDKFLRIAVQKVESINRLSTAMAAYRLELAKTGDKEAAINYADRILTETHGDYSSFNAPRFFNNPIGKVALQFRKFQLIQLTYYAKLLKDSGLDTKEKRAATEALVYSLGHTALLAGAMGLPGYSAIAWAIGALFGDDDDPLDVTAELRKFIGDEDMANLIMRGAPTLAGVDISGKVGAGNALSIMPFSRADLTTKAGVIEAAGTLLGGAPVGMAARVADGLGQMMSGEWYKGMEQVLPKGLGDAAKAYRISTEGMSRRNGDIVLPASEVSAWEALVQSMGIQPAQQSVVMERQQNTLEMSQFYQDRSTKVKAQYIKAIRAGESTAEARDAWNKLQEARVENGYTRQPLSELLKSPQSQAKREKQVVDGVQFNKANKRFVEEQI